LEHVSLDDFRAEYKAFRSEETIKSVGDAQAATWWMQTDHSPEPRPWWMQTDHSPEPRLERRLKPEIMRSCIYGWRDQLQSNYFYKFSSTGIARTMGVEVTGLPNLPEPLLVRRAQMLKDPPLRKPDDTVTIPPRFSWGDFEAISYCWESDVRDQEVVVDGIKIAIPTNLEALLQHLRYLPEARSGIGFWVDGLCINQDQLLEKNHQVRLMKQIYERAVAVIVWLGPDDRGSDMALDFLLQLSDIQTEERHGHLDKQHVVDWLNQDYQTPALWTPVIDLWSRKYFGRMWIIQELALNSRMSLFMCGQKMVPREVIQAASDFCMGYAGNLAQILSRPRQETVYPLHITRNDVWERAYNINNLVELRGESTHLDTILDLARKSSVKDPRDKVYGLLGMVSPSLAQAIVPDYSKTVQEVYVQYALALLERCSRLDEVLAWCAFVEDGTLPSWVPDWNSPFGRYHIRWFRRYFAAGDTPPTWSFVEGSQQLRCEGIPVDIVEATSSSLSESLPYREVIKSSTLTEIHAHPPVMPNNNAQVGAKSDTSWKRIQENIRRRRESMQKPVPKTDPQRKPPTLRSRPQHNATALARPIGFGKYSSEAHLMKAMFRTLVHAHEMAQIDGDLTLVDWIEWDRLEYKDECDPAIQNFWSFGAREKDVGRHEDEATPWKLFDRFRQTNANFSVLGYKFKDFFQNPERCGPQGLSAGRGWGSSETKITRERAYQIPNTQWYNIRLATVGLAGRRLITTETGYLGLAPAESRPGDTVAILYGCNYPVILRPSGDGFKYIGESYIDGLTHGEALEGLRRGEYKEEMITLV
jgi:hypothetical protein